MSDDGPMEKATETAWYPHLYATCPYCGEEQEVNELIEEANCSFCERDFYYDTEAP